MKAFTKFKYGGPEVLQIEEVEKPILKNNQLLVKVMANAANAADWHILRGKPFLARFTVGLFKPKDKILGADFAGIVEEVGNEITHFKKGDKVFGETLEGGAFAEYLAATEAVCGHMPIGSEYGEMAGVALAGITALQALITHGQIKKGESVLINGASGGVGHFAIQIAKAQGAEVTGVCSHKNAHFVRNLGADHIIAYDKENIHQHDLKYNLVVDTHGNLSHEDYKRMGQRGVLVGFTTVGHMFSVLIKNGFSKFPLKQFTAKANATDLETLAKLVQDKKIKTHIDTIFPHTKIPEAIAYIEAMHTKGKVVMTWGN